MSRHARNSCQELPHGSYNRDLARFSRGAKTLVVLSKPRITPDQLQNHHPKRFRKRAFPSGIVGPFAKRFLPD